MDAVGKHTPIPLPRWLSERGMNFHVVPIAQDGNCFFASFAMALDNYKGPVTNAAIAEVKRMASNPQTAIYHLRNQIAEAYNAEALTRAYETWNIAGKNLGGQVEAALVPVFEQMATQNGNPTVADVESARVVIRRPTPTAQHGVYWASEFAISTIERLYRVHLINIDALCSAPSFKLTPMPDSPPLFFVTLVYNGAHYEVLSDGPGVNAVYSWDTLPPIVRNAYCTQFSGPIRSNFGVECPAGLATGRDAAVQAARTCSNRVTQHGIAVNKTTDAKTQQAERANKREETSLTDNARREAERTERVARRAAMQKSQAERLAREKTVRDEKRRVAAAANAERIRVERVRVASMRAARADERAKTAAGTTELEPTPQPPPLANTTTDDGSVSDSDVDDDKQEEGVGLVCGPVGIRVMTASVSASASVPARPDPVAHARHILATIVTPPRQLPWAPLNNGKTHLSSLAARNERSITNLSRGGGRSTRGTKRKPHITRHEPRRHARSKGHKRKGLTRSRYRALSQNRTRGRKVRGHVQKHIAS